MALNKRNYVYNETIITAKNLNEIQDEVIRIGSALDDGDLKGDPGVSPTVSVSKTGKTTTITITDVVGKKTATIYDGENGATGPAGPQGETGATGAAGKTPVKGVDYFTEADKEEFLSDIDAVRYVSQTLTNEQKAQARANIGIEDADNTRVVTVENDVASHSAEEIRTAYDGRKAVFLSRGSRTIPLSQSTSASAKFVDHSFNYTVGAIMDDIYYVDSSKNVTTESKFLVLSEKIKDVIDELKESGELNGADNSLVVTAVIEDTSGTVQTGTSSHSASEIIAAKADGKAITLYVDGHDADLYEADEDSVTFRFIDITAAGHESFKVTLYIIDNDKAVSSMTIKQSSLPAQSGNTEGKFLQSSSGQAKWVDSSVIVNDVLAALPTWTGGSY